MNRRRWRSRALKLAAGLVGLLVLAEVGLQIGALLVRDKSGPGWRPGSTVHVLAVGDSHTYGGTVPPDKTYPAQLQQFLDGVEPGKYSVLNVGIPGSNTSQIANRFAVNLGRWNPDVVVIWCGANNAWNAAEATRSGLLQGLDALALRSRVYKLVRVLLNDRALNVEADKRITAQRHQLKSLDRNTQSDPFFGTIAVNNSGEEKVDEEAYQRIVADFSSIVRMAHASGAAVVFITYPLDFERFRIANRAAREVGGALGAPVVEGSPGHFRVDGEENRYTWALHPSAAVYGEIAKDVGTAILALQATGTAEPTPGATAGGPR